MTSIKKTDLVLNVDGSIYHLKLFPGDVAETIFLVGDPGRVELVASFFDTIDLKKRNREIHTITGTYKGKRLSVMSSGMGPDNIELVVNELDALFNIELDKKIEKQEKTSINLIRIGTSGALQPEIPIIHSYLVSEYGIGFDGLAYFYDKNNKVIDNELTISFLKMMDWASDLPKPYGVKASDYLLEKIGHGWRRGITLTAPGFYAPQGRELRLKVKDNTLVKRSSIYKYKDLEVTNFEMETSALYFLSSMLGHNALTICDIIANRVTHDFNPHHETSMKNLIKEVLDRIIKL